jgi:ferrous iron transport protein B
VGLKLLEDDKMIRELAASKTSLPPAEIAASLAKVNDILHETADEVIADAKYGFIHGVARDVIQRKEARHSSTEAIDRIVMHRVYSIPIFFLAMYLVFWVTINIGGAFIDFFDILFGTVFVEGFGILLDTVGTPVWLRTILAGGIGAGIQTVSTFIPIIFTMFFSLSILEDSGYMARAAFIMDRFMRVIGLPGKSFVPMIVGFGCTVPAILGTRTLDNKQDRFLTIFMTPFMSCGARLPVYAFFAAVFFGIDGGNMVFSLYLIGILVAVGTGFLLKRSIFRGDTSHFIMELPPYHSPRLKHILIHTWGRLKIFIIRAGKVITLSVVVLGFLNSLGADGSFGNENTDKSILSSIGKAVTPVFSPMGIEKENWPATVAIFSGFFAKEAVVGTLTSMYSQNAASDAGNSSNESEPINIGGKIVEAFVSIPAGLGEVFSSLLHPFGFGYGRGGAAETASVTRDETLFTTVRDNFPHGRPQAYAYLLFVLLYLPCVAALGAAVKEMGLVLGFFMAFYTTLIAWIIATLYYQLAVKGDPLWIFVPLLLLGLLVLALKLVSGREKNIRFERS